MQLTFTFDTTNKTDLSLLNKIMDMAQAIQIAQPEVANTGTTATGVSSLSPEGSGVSEQGAAEAAPAAPEKAARKPRAKKEEAAAPVEKPADTGTQATQAAASSETATASATADEAKPLTLDEVRAALQQFTAKHGVPAGIELLKEFNAGRISELDAGNYAEFVERCAA